TDDHAAISLIGPKAAKLLTMAGLPADMAVGGLGSGVVEGASAALLRVSSDHWLPPPHPGHPPRAGPALPAARPDGGVTRLGGDAVGRRAAAARPMTLL